MRCCRTAASACAPSLRAGQGSRLTTPSSANTSAAVRCCAETSSKAATRFPAGPANAISASAAGCTAPRSRLRCAADAGLRTGVRSVAKPTRSSCVGRLMNEHRCRSQAAYVPSRPMADEETFSPGRSLRSRLARDPSRGGNFDEGMTCLRRKQSSAAGASRPTPATSHARARVAARPLRGHLPSNDSSRHRAGELR